MKSPTSRAHQHDGKLDDPHLRASEAVRGYGAGRTPRSPAPTIAWAIKPSRGRAGTVVTRVGMHGSNAALRMPDKQAPRANNVNQPPAPPIRRVLASYLAMYGAATMAVPNAAIARPGARAKAVRSSRILPEGRGITGTVTGARNETGKSVTSDSGL
jgi:hypothetical protein